MASLSTMLAIVVAVFALTLNPVTALCPAESSWKTGVYTLRSQFDMPTTMTRLHDIIDAQVTATATTTRDTQFVLRADHQHLARGADHQKGTTYMAQVLTWQVHSLTAPLLRHRPTVAVDLPFRMSVYDDCAGLTWVAFTTPKYVYAMHNVDFDHKYMNNTRTMQDLFDATERYMYETVAQNVVTDDWKTYKKTKGFSSYGGTDNSTIGAFVEEYRNFAYPAFRTGVPPQQFVTNLVAAAKRENEAQEGAVDKFWTMTKIVDHATGANNYIHLTDTDQVPWNNEVIMTPMYTVMLGQPQMSHDMLGSKNGMSLSEALPLRVAAWTDMFGQSWVQYTDPVAQAAQHLAQRADVTMARVNREMRILISKAAAIIDTGSGTDHTIWNDTPAFECIATGTATGDGSCWPECHYGHECCRGRCQMPQPQQVCRARLGCWCTAVGWRPDQGWCARDYDQCHHAGGQFNTFCSLMISS